MSNKITAAKRDAAIKLLLNRAFEEREAALQKENTRIAEAAYEAKYDAATRAAMNALPEGWLAVVSQAWADYNDYGCWRGDLLCPRPVLAKDAGYSHRLDVELTPDMQAAKATAEQLCKDKTELRHKIEGVFTSCSTWNQLFTRWPEVQGVLQHMAELSKLSTPLATVPQDLNTMLKLP